MDVVWFLLFLSLIATPGHTLSCINSPLSPPEPKYFFYGETPTPLKIFSTGKGIGLNNLFEKYLQNTIQCFKIML